MTATTNESQETAMTATTAADSPTSTEQNLRVVQRVVFPANRDLDTLPLYVDPDTNKIRKQDDNGTAVVQAVGMARKLHPEDILDRGSVQVRRGERLSFGSYFNAFPASYWRKWTIATKTILHIETEGEGTVIVYRSNARGASQRVDSILVEGTASNDFELTLAPFGDGGWYWFDLIAGGDGMTLKNAHWAVPDEGRPQGKVTLGVTTFNRADYCLETIKSIDADSGLREILAELIIVDQGNKKVADEDGFDAVAASMGEQLRIINQGNLGGSGGFARNMYEMLVSDKSDYVMLLDDDIELETEGVLRAVAFADLCRKPTIVGGHMFDMYNKSVLHAYAEVVNFYRFLWGPVEGLGNHDFSAEGPSLNATAAPPLGC
ncbi:hypothetical protein StoSoilB13_14050 [Arthrobacter sp. StoSoilB13]|nr:hypothetical protein StoSoilB13_14050 [Arthrobacter sp. StoSoilB13]